MTITSCIQYSKEIMRTLLMVLLAVVAVSAIPRRPSRIIGGELTTIHRYPDMAALLIDWDNNNRFTHACGGIILNNRSILTAAHCTFLDPVCAWRSRLGSSYANSEGIVYQSAFFIYHPEYNHMTVDNDISIIRVIGEIFTTPVIRYGAIAGPNYHVPDNEVVWATGWGWISPTGPRSEQLRHVQMYTINLDICRQRFSLINNRVTDNMLCSGVLDVGGRNQCMFDSGGPLYHNGVVVGICSFGVPECGHPFWPGVNARVQRFAVWLNQTR